MISHLFSIPQKWLEEIKVKQVRKSSAICKINHSDWRLYILWKKTLLKKFLRATHPSSNYKNTFICSDNYREYKHSEDVNCRLGYLVGNEHVRELERAYLVKLVGNERINTNKCNKELFIHKSRMLQWWLQILA